MREEGFRNPKMEVWKKKKGEERGLGGMMC